MRDAGRVTSATLASPAVRRRTRRPARTVLAAALAAVGLLALAGCMKIETDFVLSEDDTVSGSVVMAFSDEFAESLGMDPQELWDSANEGDDSLVDELPDGATEEPYSDGEYTGTRITYTDQPLDQMSGGTDDLSITREGDEYVVEGVMDLSDTSTEETGELPEGLMDSFVVRIAVTFPGEISETNGEVDGTTVVWNPPVGESTEMFARGSAVGDGAAPDDSATTEETEEPATEDTAGTEDGATTDDSMTDTSEESMMVDEASSPWAWIVGAVVGLAVLGLVVWLIVRNNRSSGPPPAAGFPQGPGGAAAPPPYTSGAAPRADYGQPQQPAPPVVPPQQGPTDPYQGPADPNSTPPTPR